MAIRRRCAVFLDKDGTLVEDVPYNVDPALVRLTVGAGEAARLLNKGGYSLCVVSNQSGVGRGLFREAALESVRARIAELLAEHDVALDGFYYCPHVPDDGCQCRKPAEGLLRQAAADLALSVQHSWMVGDILDDVEAGRRAGTRTVLIDNGNETEWRLTPGRRPDLVANDLLEAARMIVALDLMSSEPRGRLASSGGGRHA